MVFQGQCVASEGDESCLTFRFAGSSHVGATASLKKDRFVPVLSVETIPPVTGLLLGLSGLLPLAEKADEGGADAPVRIRSNALRGPHRPMTDVAVRLWFCKRLVQIRRKRGDGKGDGGIDMSERFML